MDIIQIEPNPVSDLLRELSILRHSRKSGLCLDDIRKINRYMIMVYMFLRLSKEHTKDTRNTTQLYHCNYDLYLSILADHYSYFHSVITEDITVLLLIAEDNLSYAIPTRYHLLKGNEIISPCISIA